MGYHPNARVKMSHPSYLSRMRWNERWTTLGSPQVFKVGVGGDSCIGVSVHVGKVGDNKVGSKAKGMQNKSRFRVQIGC